MLLDIFDPKAPPKAIGIDLGTTHSIVSCVRDGGPHALTTCDGTPLLPSVVYYGEHKQVLVGKTAQAYASRAPEHTITSVKRWMGRGAAELGAAEKAIYRLVEGSPEEDGRVIRFDFGDRMATPVEISAEILKSLKQSAIDQLTHVGHAVITVPAYFDDAQRQATKDAGRLAGLDVVRLLNEPTAAALAYGLQEKQDGVFVVYDLGGGTFDVTILSLEGGVFQVRSTGGDSALGGDDMDRLIADRMLVTLGVSADSARAPDVHRLVLDAARQAKHVLTERERVEVELPSKGADPTLFRLSRAEFDELSRELLDRTGRACRRALRDAELTRDAIDGVILVGGATRTPCVRAFVKEFFEQEPLANIDPDLVVAHGAALQAELLATASDEVLLLDVLPLSLGVETMGGGVDKILPRNTTIPAGARSLFTTYANNQTGFDIHVLQGERELAQDCRSLARFTLGGIPPMPAGMARLEVTFHVDENSLLEVKAVELTTGLEQLVEVKPSYGLTDEQVEEMLIDALDHGEEDFAARELADARVEAERIVLATRQALTTDADLLEPSELARVAEACDQLEQACGEARKAQAVQSRLDALDAATHAWAGRRMDRAIQGAIRGKNVTQVGEKVAHAAGIEAHLQEKATKG